MGVQKVFKSLSSKSWNGHGAFEIVMDNGDPAIKTLRTSGLVHCLHRKTIQK